MKTTQLLAAGLAAACILTSAGCSREEIGEILEDMVALPPETQPVTETLELTADTADLFVDNPADIYAAETYRPELFYGKYTAPGTHGTGLEQVEQVAFCNEMSYLAFPCADRPLTKLPYRIEVGPHCNVTSLNYLNGYNWMTLRLFDEQGNRFPVRAAYTVQDDVLELRILQDYSYDADTKKLDYTFSDLTLRYGYSFNGSALTLTCDGKSVTLYAEDLSKENSVDLYDANLAEDSPAACGITLFNLKNDDPYILIDGQKIVPDSYEFSEDGLFRMSWTQDGTPHALQLVYYYCDDDGLILTDGKEHYFYNRRSWDLYTKDVSTNLDVGGAKELQNMSDAEIEALTSRKDELYTDLDQALKDAGISAKIDKKTGEIALDSVLLFDVDAFAVSPEGQSMLSKFLKAYTSVIFSEKYDGFVRSIEIEGHSDPTGDPDYNRTLSEYRANNVMEYCLSDATGLDSAVTERLSAMVTAQGYSSDRPVYKADGKVDLNASRRVSFRFVIAVGEQDAAQRSTEAPSEEETAETLPEAETSDREAS